jgi:hypothetical protein
MMFAPDLAGMTSLAYARRVGINGGAAVQAGEGAVKAVSEPIFAPQTQGAITIAGYTTISEQALSASGGLQRAVDSHLQRSVRLAVDAVLIAGTVEASWPFGGYMALAAPFAAGAGYLSIVDAIISGATRMRLEGFSPSIAVLPEAMFLQSQLAKAEGSGVYMQASVLLKDAGLRLALSESITAGKAMLIDEAFIGFLSSGATQVSLGMVNDSFIRNQVVIRAEVQILPFVSDYQGAMLVSPSVT